MAAGLGFKDFTTGEVLTAADVDGYLMQGIWVFASAAARDAAVTSPQEGNFAFLKDTNTTTYYTGSAWTNLDTTGMVNPMTTTGDTIYSSSGSTPARLGIGSTGQVLTVAGGVPTWATPGGSFVGCQVKTTATDQTTSNTTQYKVQFGVEDFDTDGFHSTTTNNSRITIPAGLGGYYYVYGIIRWLNNTTGRRLAYITKNNAISLSTEGFSVATNTQYPSNYIFEVLNLSAGDYIELEAFQSSGGNLDLECDGETIRFGVWKIG